MSEQLILLGIITAKIVQRDDEILAFAGGLSSSSRAAQLVAEEILAAVEEDRQQWSEDLKLCLSIIETLLNWPTLDPNSVTADLLQIQSIVNDLYNEAGYICVGPAAVKAMVGEMPRPPNSYAELSRDMRFPSEVRHEFWMKEVAFEEAIQAYQELLKDWRKVPTTDELYKIVREIEGVSAIAGLPRSFKFYLRLHKFCKELHSRLLEGK